MLPEMYRTFLVVGTCWMREVSILKKCFLLFQDFKLTLPSRQARWPSGKGELEKVKSRKARAEEVKDRSARPFGQLSVLPHVQRLGTHRLF
jgi:hypothetical protein